MPNLKKELLKQQIQNIIDYASINAGNDVILAQYTNDILEIFTRLSAEKDREWKEKIVKDCFWLLECEKDCLKTNGYETDVIDNLRKRFEGHFINSTSKQKKGNV